MGNLDLSARDINKRYIKGKVRDITSISRINEETGSLPPGMANDTLQYSTLPGFINEFTLLGCLTVTYNLFSKLMPTIVF